MTDFTRAAISYLGLPDDTVLIPSDPGHLAFQIPLGMALVAGIADRMNVLAEAEQDTPLPVRDMPSDEQLRQEYSALPAREVARHGSFGRYKRQRILDSMQADHVTLAVPNFDKTLPDRSKDAPQ